MRMDDYSAFTTVTFSISCICRNAFTSNKKFVYELACSFRLIYARKKCNKADNIAAASIFILRKYIFMSVCFSSIKTDGIGLHYNLYHIGYLFCQWANWNASRESGYVISAFPNELGFGPKNIMVWVGWQYKLIYVFFCSDAVAIVHMYV